MYAGVRRDNSQIVGIALSIEQVNWNPEICDTHEVPEQDVEHLYTLAPIGDGSMDIVGFWPDDLTQYSTEELSELGRLRIDAATDAIIMKTLHPFTGRGEEAAIFREQLVQILNAFGLEPTAAFAQLNKIAIAAIEEGRAKKVALLVEILGLGD